MSQCKEKLRALVNTIHTTRHGDLKNVSSSFKDSKLDEILKPSWTVLKTEVLRLQKRQEILVDAAPYPTGLDLHQRRCENLMSPIG